jgi:PPM family protein phosphatase
VLLASGISDKGRLRPTNEDCFAIDDALNLCVVADGLGGHNAGEVAARMAVDAVVDYVRSAEASRSNVGKASGSNVGMERSNTPMEREALAERESAWPFGFDDALSNEGNVLRTAIHLANVQILEAAITGEAYAGMGTTIVAAQVVHKRLIVAHVGDSRLYLLGRAGLTQITNDDSWLANVLAQDPDADPLVLQHHPMRNALTNVVGARARTDVHVVEQMLSGGEVLMLSTDGVHGVLDDARLTTLLTGDEDPRAMAGRVIAAALARGSRDNCTVIVGLYTV